MLSRSVCKNLACKITIGKDFEVVNNEFDPRFKEYWSEYDALMKRRGVSQETARREVFHNPTVIAAIMVQRGEADAMICGATGTYEEHFEVVERCWVTVMAYTWRGP
ncbi:hypothetical protein EXD76_01505 [BEV proteobacterium]|nr:hypothetical protein [Candidatus Symbiopectobacterium sp. Chty_BC]